jgi:hypothetical protein
MSLLGAQTKNRATKQMRFIFARSLSWFEKNRPRSPYNNKRRLLFCWRPKRPIAYGLHIAAVNRQD